MPDGFKVSFAQQVLDVLLTGNKKIVHADYLQKQELGCLLQGKQIKCKVTEEREMTMVCTRPAVCSLPSAPAVMGFTAVRKTHLPATDVS